LAQRDLLIPPTSAEVGGGKRIAVNKRSQDKSTENNNNKR